MKMKFRGITLTALLLSASNLTFAEQGASSTVGDLPDFGEEAYFEGGDFEASPNPEADSQEYPVQAVTHVSDDTPAHQYVGSDEPVFESVEPEYAPIRVGELQQVGHSFGSRVRRSSCRTGCDSRYRRGRFYSLLDAVDHDLWATYDTLLWFTPNREMPALVTVSPVGTNPALPEPGGSGQGVAVFGDDIQGELSAGYRSDFGKWISDSIGIGGRFMYLFENNDSYFGAAGPGDNSLGRPFFNVNRPSPPAPTTFGQDAVLIGLNGFFEGAVAAESELDLWGAELYTRMKVCYDRGYSLELIGGYSHFEIKDTLRISSTSIQTNPPTLQTTTLADFFESENRFNGGQVGFEMVMQRGRWMARSLTKVHLGNVNQRTRILGVNTVENPGPIVNSTGMLAQGNQGVFERDVFGFIPEANFKLAYKVREHLLLSVGYSFLYFDNVALNGDAVSTVLDGTTIGNGLVSSTPTFNFQDSSLWVQGIDLGIIFDF